MPVNVGIVDVRIIVGLALVAFAFQNGLSIEGWHWAGLIGMAPRFIAPWGFRSVLFVNRQTRYVPTSQAGRAVDRAELW
jgi:hypothetical protein